MTEVDTDDLELDLVLEILRRRYGYDFRNYMRASLRRRLNAALERRNLDTLVDMVPDLVRDHDVGLALVDEITTPFSEMFRDPDFFGAFRDHVVPSLSTYPRPRIWVAGCAAGHEAYSIAILLEEAGIYDRCEVIATDINRRALKHAAEGVYSVDQGRRFTENYLAFGGSRSPADYYHAAYGSIRLDARLRRRLTFVEQDLTRAQPPGSFHAVLCRNVLIYFDRKLQDRVVDRLLSSLVRRGHLCLGKGETLDLIAVGTEFEAVDRPTRIFRRVTRR